jgi:hypothetical protein
VANDQVVHPLRPMSASPASGTDAC